LQGFYELIPRETISIFNHKELELLIAGLPDFDINDLKAQIEYEGYSANSPQIKWFFEILEQFD
jgi:E3 ubiquitin-protein ligase HUWE1